MYPHDITSGGIFDISQLKMFPHCTFLRHRFYPSNTFFSLSLVTGGGEERKRQVKYRKAIYTWWNNDKTFVITLWQQFFWNALYFYFLTLYKKAVPHSNVHFCVNLSFRFCDDQSDLWGLQDVFLVRLRVWGEYFRMSRIKGNNWITWITFPPPIVYNSDKLKCKWKIV